MPDYAIHPQSLLMETTWVCSWFSRVLQRAKAARRAGRPQVVIADRSPFSAILYARGGGALLEPVIRAHVEEVSREALVHVTTAYLHVDSEPLWDRISARLAREPHRARYNEGDRSWMDKALAFYESFRWDMTVPNDSSLEDLLLNTKRTTARAFPEFAHLLHPESAPEELPSAADRASPPLPVAHAVHTPVIAKHRRDPVGISPALSVGHAADDDDFIVAAEVAASAAAPLNNDQHTSSSPLHRSPSLPDVLQRKQDMDSTAETTTTASALIDA